MQVCPKEQRHLRSLYADTAYQQTHLIPTFKHGAGGLMLWTWFDDRGPGHLAVLEFAMNSSLYQNILKSDVGLSVQHVKLG